MKYTLLEMVQEILSDMDSDNVNSYMDTFESEQVAQIIKSTFFSIVSNRDWPHLKQLTSLTPSGSLSLPTHMYLEEGVTKLVSVNYNCAKVGETRRFYRPVEWREPDNFLQLTNAQNSDTGFVDVIVDPSGIELLIRNNQNPTYFTSFDDKTLVFNSYDSDTDDTLQESKVQAQAYIMPGWEMVDTFVPDLPAEAFIALVEEAKSRAMLRLKQMEDPKAEQESRRQQRWLSRNDWRVKGGIKTPNYGRKANKMRREPTFERNDY